MLVLSLGLGSQVSAQKIGYVNFELVLVYLPEVQNMNSQLQSFQKSKVQEIEVTSNYYKTKFQEYSQRSQAGASEQELLPLQQEIQKIGQEIQNAESKAQNDLANKQSEMMAPILEKVEGEIKKMAQEMGYDFILNSSASGTSVVIHGDEGDELSRTLLSRLGVNVSL